MLAVPSRVGELDDPVAVENQSSRGEERRGLQRRPNQRKIRTLGHFGTIRSWSCPSELGAEKQRSILTLLRDRNLGLPTDFEDPGDDFGCISALLGTECWSFTDPWSIIGNWQRQTLQKADVTSLEPLE